MSYPTHAAGFDQHLLFAYRVLGAVGENTENELTVTHIHLQQQDHHHQKD